MFSNKTNLMIMRVNDLRAQNKTVIVLAWLSAIRRDVEGQDVLCSKSLTPTSCVRTDGRQLMQYLDRAAGYDVVAVDDAHFFTDLTEFVDHLVYDHHRTVLLSTLLEDKNGNLWENGVDRIFFSAEEAIRLNSVCAFCYQKTAVHTIWVGEKEQEGVVVVGGEEKYKPICRHCRRQRLSE